jgi:uncharacterized protein (UPF0212 family)
MTLVMDKTEVIAEATMDLMGSTWTCDIHGVEVEIGAGDCPECVTEIGPPDYIPADWLE